MARSESNRRDLYTALSDVIGPEHAATLMDSLPTQPADRLVTKEDLDLLELRLVARLEGVETRMGGLEIRMDRLETRFETSILALNQRLDRLFLALLAGMAAVVGTVITAFFAL